MCWYLNGRKCLISYLLILRDHASLWLGNKHETKLEAKKSNFTVWSQLVYNDSHANFALEQILIPQALPLSVWDFAHIFTIKLYNAHNILVPQEKFLQNKI